MSSGAGAGTGAGAGGAAMSVDMRHTKLSAAEAALIAGELVKPSWASRNEGIHERISFDDTLWGFELAGGVYYNTPLRVVYVKPGSRAELACIRKGDTVKRINGIDTATLSLDEAHEIIVNSGIHLKISVSSPEDEENAYYTYEDPLVDEGALAEQLRKAMEADRIRRAIERANRNCNLPWPWVRRKIIIYRESNCFLVPSKYENKHKELFPELPHVRYTDDIAEINRGSPVDWSKPAASEERGKGEPGASNDDASVLDEREADRILDEILEAGEDSGKNLPSDVEEPSRSDADVDEPHGEMNGELVGPDSEEDAADPDKHKGNVEDVDTLESMDKNGALEDNNSQQADGDREPNEESSTLDSNVEDLENVGDTVDENVEQIDESEVEVNPPASDYVNEDHVTKSEDDNVVDGIVGGGGMDSTNER